MVREVRRSEVGFQRSSTIEQMVSGGGPSRRCYYFLSHVVCGLNPVRIANCDQMASAGRAQPDCRNRAFPVAELARGFSDGEKVLGVLAVTQDVVRRRDR